MTTNKVKARDRRSGWLRGLIRRFTRGQRGSISPLMAMALVPIIGAMAMGTEEANWWLLQRQAQNAADSAAIAAANAGSVNGVSTCGTTGDYCAEAKGVAKSYGFVNGANNTTVGVLDNQNCPSPLTATDCFKVSITRTVPVTLLSIVGFKGSQGDGTQKISASATAWANGSAFNNITFCVVALGSLVNKNLTVNGGPNSNLNGCAIGSNGSTTCNGGGIDNLSYSFGMPGFTNDCAPNSANDITLRAKITDPYNVAGNSQSSDIPANTCANPTVKSSYPQIATLHGNQTANWTQISGSPTWAGTTKIFCGDVQLTANTTVTAGTIMVIENGALDLNGFSLTAPNSTIIFTGPSIAGFTPSHIVEDTTSTAGSTLTISAPTGTWNGPTATWTGFAIYQDPAIAESKTAGIDMTFAGNKPTLQITGLYYAPNSSVTISGTIGSAGACIGFLVDTIVINGTGQIIESNSCDPVNLTSNNQGFLSGLVELVK